MFSIYFLIFAILIFIINLFFSKKERNTHFILETFLKWFFLVIVGLGCVFAFMGHTFHSDETAKMIGWGTGSPFQFEVAMANLAIGITGIFAFWFRKTYWLAASIVYAVFLLGAACVHIMQMAENNNYSPLNSGFFLWFNDITLPIIIFILVLWYLKLDKKK